MACNEYGHEHRESTVRHAAHYLGGGGHDLEQWDVSGTAWRPYSLVVERPDVPSSASYAYGYIDKNGEQHWVFTRVCPLDAGTCERCGAGR